MVGSLFVNRLRDSSKSASESQYLGNYAILEEGDAHLDDDIQHKSETVYGINVKTGDSSR